MALRWLFDRLRPHQNEAGGEPPAKRQKKVVATTDRVKLNVGGAEFETTVVTLTSNSAYFASLFSDNWSQSKDCDGGALFLDQDPAAFATLLAYMRCGMIKTDEIDVNVTALAEFLGIEQLLRAIKIRWYINIGKGPVVAEEDDIAAAFDREHGGILNALSSGLFHYFRNGNTVDAEWDFAILTVTFSNPERPDFSNCTVAVNELRGGEAGQVTPCGGAVGALNGLSAKGYNLLVSDDTEFGWYGKFSFAFARKSHSVMHSRAMSDVLIPADECALAQVTLSKQYAIHVKDTVGGDEWFIAPGEFGDDADPFAEARVSDEAGDETNFWLKKHNFHTRDKALEQHPFIQKYLTFLRAEGGGPRACAIYYRLLPREHEGK